MILMLTQKKDENAAQTRSGPVINRPAWQIVHGVVIAPQDAS